MLLKYTFEDYKHLLVEGIEIYVSKVFYFYQVFEIVFKLPEIQKMTIVRVWKKKMLSTCQSQKI